MPSEVKGSSTHVTTASLAPCKATIPVVPRPPAASPPPSCRLTPALLPPHPRRPAASPPPSRRLTPAVPPASPQHPACLTLPSFPLHPHCHSRSFKRESMDFSPPLQVCKRIFIGVYLERQRESHDTLMKFFTPHPSPPPQGGREQGHFPCRHDVERSSTQTGRRRPSTLPVPPNPPSSFPLHPLCHSRSTPSVIPAVLSGNPGIFPRPYKSAKGSSSEVISNGSARAMTH